MSQVVRGRHLIFRSTWSSGTGLRQVCLSLASLLHYLLSMLISFVFEDTIISSFTADYLSTYLSLCPSPSDAVLSLGPMDFMITSAPHYLPTRLYNVFPHPAQDPSEKRKYLVMLTSRYVACIFLLMWDIKLTYVVAMRMYHEPWSETCTPRVGVLSTA